MWQSRKASWRRQYLRGTLCDLSWSSHYLWKFPRTLLPPSLCPSRAALLHCPLHVPQPRSPVSGTHCSLKEEVLKLCMHLLHSLQASVFGGQHLQAPAPLLLHPVADLGQGREVWTWGVPGAMSLSWFPNSPGGGDLLTLSYSVAGPAPTGLDETFPALGRRDSLGRVGALSSSSNT